MPAARSPALRRPLQARSQASTERMLAAAAEAIALHGFAGATMVDVARRARSSIGALYARFRDKEALLACLHERFCAAALERVESALAPERFEGVPAAGIVRAVVAELLRVDRDEAALVRAFVGHGAVDPTYAARAARVGRALSRRLQALLSTRPDELSCPDPGAAIDFGVWLVLAHLDQRAVYGDVETTDRARSERARREELSRVLEAALGIQGPRAPRSAAPAAPGARPGDTRR